MALREALRRCRNSKNPLLRHTTGFIAAVYRAVTAPEYRAILKLRLLQPGEIHQTTVLTGMDRYPAVFAICRDYFASTPDLRILSYGCATGEEVLTLRRYFPTALIVGAEINRHSLSVARSRPVDDRIVFIESEAALIRPYAPFDAIFCMAVLQRTPMHVAEAGIRDLKRLYPFEKFEAKVMELDAWLKKDGLLIAHNSQYSLADAAIGSKYTPLDSARHILNPGPRFDRQSLRCDVPAHSIFVKLRE